ncbi:MAG: BlaB/IND/MUS family subclass B1 metallo-beta-lactamase [Ferruginibacter sp.]
MRSFLIIVSTLFMSFLSTGLCGQPGTPALKISPLTEAFYVYTTYSLYNKVPVPSNSMYLVTTEGIVMFDTPWDTTQFQVLLDSMELRHHQKVVLCLSTHFHADRTAGLSFLKQKGISTYSSKKTFDLCKIHKENIAAFYFVNDTSFTVGNHVFQAYYPGEGHSKDNIVVWFNKEKILYGGCFIKSTETNELGNIRDANLMEWPKSVRKVIKKFPRPAYVIPGHLGWENNKGLQHTLNLLTASGEKHHGNL